MKWTAILLALQMSFYAIPVAPVYASYDDPTSYDSYGDPLYDPYSDPYEVQEEMDYYAALSNSIAGHIVGPSPNLITVVGPGKL